MNKSIGKWKPTHQVLGKFVEKLSVPIVRIIGKILQFNYFGNSFSNKIASELLDRISKGETVYLLGIGPSGHNSAAALVEISPEKGICPICNNEEERFTNIRHDANFPALSVKNLLEILERKGKKPQDILAVLASWDYLKGISTSLRTALEEAPGSFYLLNKASSPHMNAWHFIEALRAPKLLKQSFGSSRRVPVIGMRHHNNHAYYPYAISPFGGSDKTTMIMVLDGFGDDGSISLYQAKGNNVELMRRVPCIFDSLGLLYSILSSTQGGWATLSSEGRYMGASAWGDLNRLTNPFYKKLRQIIYFGSDGEVFINKSLINYHKRGQIKPYSKRLIEIFGEPIPQEKMWNPDCVLNIDGIEHADITQERVDKAAAMQMVFEDALFHIVDYLIRKTGSHQLILSGGTALNCIANMNLLKIFDESYYFRVLKQENARLHLWVPPNPSDTGASMGAAYQFAMLSGAGLGPKMKHAFLCGSTPSSQDILGAITNSDEVKHIVLGNIKKQEDLDNIADFIAYIIYKNGIVGLYQGTSETGPRALGHRSILANPCNPKTLEVINSHVKYRERIRPLAPMITLPYAQRFFELSGGASDDNYNAYNYMVLTVEAKPEAYKMIPAVIHKDGTSRIQIVREETDKFSFAVLKALGHRIGVEAAVNTSLNVGTPMVQHPEQAINTLKRSKGLTGIFMIGEDGTTFLVWHDVEQPPKDKGHQLMHWKKEWEDMTE
jgi:carbamoyltransferase